MHINPCVARPSELVGWQGSQGHSRQAGRRPVMCQCASAKSARDKNDEQRTPRELYKPCYGVWSACVIDTIRIHSFAVVVVYISIEYMVCDKQFISSQSTSEPAVCGGCEDHRAMIYRSITKEASHASRAIYRELGVVISQFTCDDVRAMRRVFCLPSVSVVINPQHRLRDAHTRTTRTTAFRYKSSPAYIILAALAYKDSAPSSLCDEHKLKAILHGARATHL